MRMALCRLGMLLCLLAPRLVQAHETTAPVLKQKVDAVYPRAALEAGVEGTVVLELYIDARGAVEHVHVMSSPGSGLDEAAAAAARQFQFKPATIDAAPVASKVIYEQKFAINRTVRGEVTAETPPPQATVLPSAPGYETVVVGRGPLTSASAQVVRDQDFELRPRASPNDILRVAPGLVTAQHQGGGKADQLFLRGFDADHGTDVAVFLDGIPINLPSHAHGQGYADLHFVIPELLGTVEVYKGAYYPQFGDFATAGAVNLVTRRALPQSFLSASYGSFDSARFLGVAAPDTDRLHSLVAVEAAQTDGPFRHPERLRRYSLLAKSSYDLSPATAVGLLATAYASEWTGSGQIPADLVGTELRDRFDAIDPTEGGSTERETVSWFLESRPDPRSRFDARLYYTHYKLALWNDFTFFLRNPPGGDEIEQDDARSVLGGNLEYELNRRWRGANFKSILGAQFRRDDAHVERWNASARKRLDQQASADPRIANLALYLAEDVLWSRWLRTVAAVRGDYFDWDVDDRAQPSASGVAQRALASPKASVVLTPRPTLDFYLNFGTGFHSNDAHVREKVGNLVPRAYEWEVGARTRIADRIDAAFAFWYIYLQSEIVFEGDSGTFVPSGATERYGLDLELRARILPWLVADADVALAHAEFARGGQVPLAPRLTFTGGLTARHPRGWKAALRVRGVGDRPIIDPEDAPRFGTQPVPQAEGYTLLDGFAGYEHPRFEIGIALENLTDTSWREAQFANRSCTQAENRDAASACYVDPATGVRPREADILPRVHFTPGNPFNVMATLRLNF